jgi:type VI secretion system secreted protein VgrG
MSVSAESVISFEIGGLDSETFLVRQFEGTESLSRPYRFEIKTLVMDQPLDRDKVLGKTAHLVVKGDGFKVTRHGIVTAMEQTPDGGSVEKCFCNLVVEPRLILSQYTVQSRIFQDMDVIEIATEVFKGTGLAVTTDWKKVLQDAPPKREFTVQYNETDLDFISRLLEDEGIFYFFDHTGKTELLVLADNTDAIKAAADTPKLPLIPDSGQSRQEKDHVLSFRRVDKLVTSKVTVKDYNYRTPDSPITGTDVAQEKGPGELYIYGPHSKYVDHASRLAKIRNQMLSAEKTVFYGLSNARALMPGVRFTLVDTTRQGFDGEYSVVRIIHRGHMGEMADDPAAEVYHNDFELIPATTPYRPELVTPKPKIQGILPASVDGQKGQYAYIDEAGRYKAKFFFDRTDKKDGSATKAIRMAQPYAGANYGMHFPLHTGTEIAVGFADGDPDRPIGLGSVPNPQTGSPVKAGNKSQNLMKSHSGNQICLEDKDGSTGVHINSSGGHKVGLDDSGGSKGITLTTSANNALALDDTNKKASLTTTAGPALVLDEAGKKISMTTAGGNSLTMEDPGTKIVLKDGSGNVTLTIEGGAGKLSISASTEISLTCGAASLTLKKDGTIDMNGKDVTMKGTSSATVDGGPKAALKSADTAVSGTGSVSISGGDVTSEAKKSHATKGALVSSEATSVNTIKGGAAVMLNP